ncbi:MAG: protein kinase [Candidatus Schekmanbacteria bacterium]|nr:protein kinase [Candidatus Schekmanbacteria bacterium]
MAPGDLLLGKYRIERELGRGAMGIVYQAVDTFIGRRVAIKTVTFEGAATAEATAALAARFTIESQAAGRLSHPNIVTIHDAGKAGELSYIVMELIAGKTLARLIQESSVPRPQAISIARQIAGALAYAHARGIIHRDIKPANIMLCAGNQVKIADFGIAKVAAGTAQFTATGDLIGTPGYMSPEQAKGARVDGRSDLFSLAVTLYQCVAGRPPFTGEHIPELLYHIVYADVPPLELTSAQLRDAYTAFFARALAKDPDVRFQDGDAFAEALEHLGALEAQQAAAEEGAPGFSGTRKGTNGGPSVAETPPRVARNRQMAGLATGIAAAAAAFAVVSLRSPDIAPSSSPVAISAARVERTVAGPLATPSPPAPPLTPSQSPPPYRRQVVTGSQPVAASRRIPRPTAGPQLRAAPPPVPSPTADIAGPEITSPPAPDLIPAPAPSIPPPAPPAAAAAALAQLSFAMPASAERGKELSLEVRAEGFDAERVDIYFRTAPDRSFSSISMTKVDARRYAATIPAKDLRAESLWFFFAARDHVGKTVEHGTASEPLALELRESHRHTAAEIPISF